MHGCRLSVKSVCQMEKLGGTGARLSKGSRTMHPVISSSSRFVRPTTGLGQFIRSSVSVMSNVLSLIFSPVYIYIYTVRLPLRAHLAITLRYGRMADPERSVNAAKYTEWWLQVAAKVDSGLCLVARKRYSEAKRLQPRKQRPDTESC